MVRLKSSRFGRLWLVLVVLCFTTLSLVSLTAARPAAQAVQDGQIESRGADTLHHGAVFEGQLVEKRQQHQHQPQQTQQQPQRPPAQQTAQQTAQQQVSQQKNGGSAFTGIVPGPVQVRRNIRDLQNQYPDQFNLLVLALQRMQQTNQSQTSSYFQLAGIHGVPANNWNGVTGTQQSQGPGWCTHVSNLFLTWHRPYVAVFEQILVLNAQQIAQEFPSGQQRDRYVAAANQLRVPYFDWAADPPPGENVLPSVFTQQKIQVYAPAGLAIIDNPLYSYKFNPIDPGLWFQPYIFWPETLRWPNSAGVGAQTQSQVMQAQINANQVQMKQRLYTLLTSINNYTLVGTYAWLPENGPGSYDSFESMHDQMHGTIGGGNFGDMGIIPVSSFDPVFWFHHAMIDRGFAMWQSLYPDSYVQPMRQRQGAYWYNAGDTFTSQTPLKPFHARSDGTFWTSDSARSTKSFGYTYPELQNNDQASVRRAINTLYGNLPGPPRHRKREATATSTPSTLARLVRNIKRAAANGFHRWGSTSFSVPISAANPRYYQLNFRAPKNTLDKTFYIDFFLGKPTSEDPTTWLADPNNIGSQAVLSMDRTGQDDVTITGVLPLNRNLERLVQTGRLSDLDEDDVVALLQNNVAWRVRSTDYSPVPLDKIPEFQVSIASIAYVPAKDSSEFPRYLGDWTIYESVTAGKPGGLDDATDI